jgi:hypothetical protein
MMAAAKQGLNNYQLRAIHEKLRMPFGTRAKGTGADGVRGVVVRTVLNCAQFTKKPRIPFGTRGYWH